MHPHTPPLRGPHGLGELVKKIETSAASLKKRVRICRKKLKAVTKEHRRIAKAKGLFAVAATLTFAKESDFCAKHITRFLSCLRSKLKRQGHQLLYAWVLERAGALHYHLALWLPRGFKLDSAELAKWWPWGSTWNEACRKVSAWIHYISKRNCKKDLPKGARAFGCGGLDAQGKQTTQYAMFPRWLKAAVPPSAKVKRVAKVGWINMETGEVYESPWIWTPRGCRLKAKEATGQ
ncbi:rolling circle replication-associated protein [Comamonas jiangduensis]|uniref:rolling circle replication-associated protein n=1 Tax=Comamonas jiangduensis TaxID=1194168 RepID=UPI003BF81EB2